eukprot:3344851-Rhodomonas_salina.2
MCGGARMWDADGGQESIPARSIFGRSASARLCPPRCAPASTPPAPVRTIGMGHTSSNISRNMSQMPVVNNTISVCVDAGQSASSQAWNSYLQVALYPVLARFNPRMLPAIAISNPKGLNSGSASSTKRSRMWYWIELQRTQSPRVIRTSSQRPKTTKTKRYQDYNPSSLSVTISRFVPFGSSRPPQRHFTQLTSLLGRRRASAVPTPRQTSRPCRRGELPHALSAPDITHLSLIHISEPTRPRLI